MTQIHNIRELYFLEGKNFSEIARETGHDRKTIREYINKVILEQIWENRQAA